MTQPALQIFSPNAHSTRQLGQQLGQLLQPRDVVCLVGSLGAGKTTFAAGVGQGWGSTSRLTSPTYTLVHEHHRSADSQTLYHVDAYRLETPDALESVGFGDIWEGDGPILIEWPERLGEMLPSEHLWIEIEADSELDENQRTLRFWARGERVGQLLAAFEASGK
ncbi:MAG: tRNA (adenosine(37)-N6)-threonylcarbamoyltransferase complex ATPase subunit type 1 TsaE [Chloroflexi bacterium]|nr:tRNA (adenosine(37)-N6)-threonylcarbamoyltransferase complex ATPase subunit type 1 TsaE [Chloroflexota bacterium]